MFPRALLGFFVVVAFAACQTPYKKKDKEESAQNRNTAGDHAFQAFVGRLRVAVEKRDTQILATMMAPDFGYRWDPSPPGETPFEYWTQNNLWPELASVLKERFLPQDLYMKAPPQAVNDPSYPGYRAGMRVIGGTWKFAYFVPAEP
jgi:hypothetical protein